MTPQLPSQGSFVDLFDRPDTALGLGEGWDMRGDDNGSTMPAATDGFIRDGHYTYAGASVVYAARQFRGSVRGMGTVGRFRKIGAGPETSLSMATSPNGELTTDMVQFTANPLGWELRLRRANAGLEPVMKGKFLPNLKLDVDYQFEFEVTDDTVTVRIPGAEVTRNSSTAGLLGDRAFWQEYVRGPPAGVVFDFDSVWAVEDGLPLFPVDG
jgi:hypothetical protein